MPSKTAKKAEEAHIELENMIKSGTCDETAFNSLIKKGLDVNKPIKYSKYYYYSPVTFCVIYHNLDCLKLLIKFRSNVNKIEGDSSTALSNVCKFGGIEIANALFDAGAKIQNKYLIYRAIEDDNNDLVEVLIEHGANVNEKNIFNETPIFLACKKENIDMGLIDLLLRNNADVNIKNSGNYTPLMEACKKNNFGLVMMLMRAGADVDVKNVDGTTAYDLTTNKQIKHFLLEPFEEDLLNGFDPNMEVISNMSQKEQEARHNLISKSRNLALHKLFKDNNVHLNHETLEELTQSLLYEGLGKKHKNIKKSKKQKSKQKYKRTRKYKK